MQSRCVRCGSPFTPGQRACACGWKMDQKVTFLFELTPAERRMLEDLRKPAETEREEIMRPVIGFDFGNYNSYMCFVSDPEPGNIRQGALRDLVPDKLPAGIPTVYYYSRKKGTQIGEAADRMKPVRNQARYLKLRMGETMELDGVRIRCDDAIVQVAQHCLRQAVRKMQNEFQITSNLVALAYPARYNQAQRNHLAELIEQAEMEDGRKFEVVGTILEPAAASLSYLHEKRLEADPEGPGVPETLMGDTVTGLSFDVGGGTFDLCLLRLYPNGRKRRDGSTYYYEILDRGGILDMGGKDFDEVLQKLMMDGLRSGAGRRMQEEVLEQTERIKRNLTDHDRAIAQVYDDEEEDYVDIEVTLEAFEQASRRLLNDMIAETKSFMQKNPDPARSLDFFLLTGGACQMPMIRSALEEAFPQYRDKMDVYKPEKAVAYGAARFGVARENVVQRIDREVGIRYYHSAEDKKGYISCCIQPGSELPAAKEVVSTTLSENQRRSRFKVYEAVTEHPDREEPERDYQEIMSVYLEYGEVVPVGTESTNRLTVDERGILTIHVSVNWSDEVIPVQKSIELKNLSI